MRVVMVSPWGSARCGLRTYTKYLVRELSRFCDVWVVPHVRHAVPDRHYVMWLARRVCSLRPDVLHVQHEYGVWGVRDPDLFAGFLSAVGAGVKVVTMHSTGLLMHDSLISRLADAVITHNEFMRDSFAGDKGKVYVIPHGCLAVAVGRDVARAKLRVPKDKYLVGVFGFIDWRKGHDLALEVIKRVRGRGVGVDAVFVGGWHGVVATPFMRAVLARAKELGVRVTGYVSDEVFELWLSAVDVVLYPARAMSESGVVAAALGAGKPVVAFKHPALKDKPVITCPSLDDMVDAVVRLRDPRERVRWGVKARGYGERFSWHAVAGIHHDLYRNLITS